MDDLVYVVDYKFICICLSGVTFMVTIFIRWPMDRLLRLMAHTRVSGAAIRQKLKMSYLLFLLPLKHKNGDQFIFIGNTFG